MTKLEGMTIDQMLKDCDVASSSFGLCASFAIRHSTFVLRHFFRIFEFQISSFADTVICNASLLSFH
jgi:hypothetical protein